LCLRPVVALVTVSVVPPLVVERGSGFAGRRGWTLIPGWLLRVTGAEGLLGVVRVPMVLAGREEPPVLPAVWVLCVVPASDRCVAPVLLPPA
jgi:hypothetical protein